MQAHEILRKAAGIVAQGWANEHDALDATGREVPLFGGTTMRAEKPIAQCMGQKRFVFPQIFDPTT